MDEPVRILVTRGDEGWTVSCSHCDRSWSWELMSEATRSARAHVGSLPEGRVSQILVQRNGGAPEPDWTLGEDAFPPES